MVLLYIGLWLVQKFSPLSRPITTWSPALSRALGSSLAFTLRSHSFYKLFSFLLIGCWNFFWFWFCVTQSKIAQSQNIEINWQVQVSRELRQIKKTIKTLLSYSTELKCVDINRCVFFFLLFLSLLNLSKWFLHWVTDDHLKGDIMHWVHENFNPF